ATKLRTQTPNSTALLAQTHRPVTGASGIAFFGERHSLYSMSDNTPVPTLSWGIGRAHVVPCWSILFPAESAWEKWRDCLRRCHNTTSTPNNCGQTSNTVGCIRHHTPRTDFQ
ncbi:unnamed protein product, partial [Ectocarpus fasciculatus]